MTDSETPEAWETARVRRHLLSLENRQRLVDHVERRPGIHLRQLARDLDLAIGTTEHHLHLLVRHGVLERHDQGGHAAYFVAGACPGPERRLLCALRHDTPRRLLRALAADPDLDVPALATRLGVSRSAVAHHLAKLIGEGLVERLRVGRASLLQVRCRDELAQALSVYDRHHPVLPWPGLRPLPASIPAQTPAQAPTPEAVPLESNECPPGEPAVAEVPAQAVPHAAPGRSSTA